MKEVQLIFNLSVDESRGVDVAHLFRQLDAYFRPGQVTPLPGQPLEAELTALAPGEALLCGEAVPRELPEAILAVSKAVEAATKVDAQMPGAVHSASLMPHLKALVSALDHQLIPKPVCAAPGPDPERTPLEQAAIAVRAIKEASAVLGRKPLPVAEYRQALDQLSDASEAITRLYLEHCQGVLGKKGAAMK